MTTTLTMFTSDTCAPCRAMKPFVERIADEVGIPVTTINASETPDLVPEDVTGTPCFVLEKDHAEVRRHTGPMTPGTFRDFLS